MVREPWQVRDMLDTVRITSPKGDMEIEMYDMSGDTATNPVALREQVLNVRPHVVLVCFPADSEESLDRVTSYWLPQVQQCMEQVRVIEPPTTTSTCAP